MAAVVVRVPSADIRAVGMSIRPVTPKSDANEGTEKITAIQVTVSRRISIRLTLSISLKKGINDALF